jgi:hypothetical protein
MSQVNADIQEIITRLYTEFEHARAQFGQSKSVDDYIFYANIMSMKKLEIEYFEKLILM